MAHPVTNFQQRRISAWLVLLVASLILGLVAWIGGVARWPVATYSGILLYLLLLLLTAFNSRKKIPFFPLLKASTWLQFHIYAGLFSVLLYGAHTGFDWPHSLIERLLTLTFFFVSISGLIGIFLSRWLPKRMRASGEAITYEKIPSLRRELIASIEACVLDAERTTGSSTLSDFYLNRLRNYFTQHPSLFRSVFPSNEDVQLVSETEDLIRYLDDKEKAYQARLIEALERKRHFDLMESANRLLRVWLFIHIPFTYSLLIFGLVHGLVVLMYGGTR